MDSGHQFGHRVWCLVHVEPKLVLEPSKSEDTLKIVNEESKEDKQVKPRLGTLCKSCSPIHCFPLYTFNFSTHHTSLCMIYKLKLLF